MRILLVGAGGVGTAIAKIAARRAFAELVVADYDISRAQRAAGQEFTAVQLDARDEEGVASQRPEAGGVLRPPAQRPDDGVLRGVGN